MLTDLLAHQYVDDPKSANEDEDHGFDLDAEMAEADAAAEAAAAASDPGDWEDLT